MIKDKKLKKKWLKALRSGQYKQGKGSLCDPSGENFCCLGVLADIQGCEWIEDSLTKERPNDDDAGLVPVIPGTRRKIAKLTTDMLPPKWAGGLDKNQQNALAALNDGGTSFKKIADKIEEVY